MAVPIIIFLGNPGDRHAATRHNVGWWVGDRLAAKAKTGFAAGHGRFLLSQVRLAGQPALLVKPTTYMNASGEAIVELSRSHAVEPESLMVVLDDLALALGQIRIRAGGSAGGHNGLASMIAHLGTDQFTRVRCGIGPLPAGVDAAEFVLDLFRPDELIVAQEMAGRAAEAVELILARGVHAAANVFNRRPPAPESSTLDMPGAVRPKEGE